MDTLSKTEHRGTHRPQALLIYDGDCAYCRAFARLLCALDRRGQFRQLPFDAPDAQALLRAQFGVDSGFAMYLTEADRIHWGARAAERVMARLSAPTWISRLAFRSYPTLVSIVSRLSRRRRTVCGPACAAGASNDGDRDHGSLELSADARETLRNLIDHTSTAARSP